MRIVKFFIIVISIISLLQFLVPFSNTVYAQTDNTDQKETRSWTSQRDNLNVTMLLKPLVPTIDQPTELHFKVMELNSGSPYEHLTANVTIVDSDGRLFKFPGQPVINGEFYVIYIFPDDAQNNILLQLNKNSTSVGLASFNVNVPPLPLPDNWFEQLFSPRPF